MNIELIPEAGKFYKANMHCHTNISDGTRSPEEVKAWYKAAGYSAVCFTDHEVLIGHKELCDDELLRCTATRSRSSVILPPTRHTLCRSITST